MPKVDKKFDVRTVQRFVRDGIVSREEYDEFVENLPDVSDKAAKMEAEFVDGVLDDEEEAADESDEEEQEEQDA